MDAGRTAEQTVALWLRQQGLRIIEQNFASKGGEIDIVALDGSTLVFVEVRLRRPSRYASGSASVDWRKQRKLARAAARYLQIRPHWRNHPCRFDVVALEQPQSPPAPDAWIRAAFTT